MDVHKNILQLSVDGKVTLMKPVIANVQTINVTKLKGHNLSTNTLRNSVPAFSLQIYCNPCLRWLIQPAFVLLVVKSMNEQCFSSGKQIEQKTREQQNDVHCNHIVQRRNETTWAYTKVISLASTNESNATVSFPFCWNNFRCDMRILSLFLIVEQIQENFFRLRKLFSAEFVLDTEPEVQNEVRIGTLPL